MMARRKITELYLVIDFTMLAGKPLTGRPEFDTAAVGHIEGKLEDGTEFRIEAPGLTLALP